VTECPRASQVKEIKARRAGKGRKDWQMEEVGDFSRIDPYKISMIMVKEENAVSNVIVQDSSCGTVKDIKKKCNLILVVLKTTT